MSRVVYLHIGAPKTGTTYLQDRLMLNQSSLADHGVTIPTKSRFVDADLFHFRAALDLLEQDWGGAPGHAQGAWDTMVKRVRRASGTVIISHEILAPAKPDKIARVMNDLAGSEIHVVYSARDLGRQLPAAWQESIKQGRKWTFNRFLTKVERGRTWFRSAMDLPAVLGSWGAKLPPSGCTSSPCRTTAARPATSCGSGSAAPSASTRRGRRWTPSAPTAAWGSRRPSSYAASTGASSCRCGAMRPTTA